MKLKSLLFVALLCALFAFPALALAQDTAPILSNAQTDLELALAAFLELVYSITFSPLTAAFVVASTAILKKLLPASIGAGTIAIVMQVLAWVALTLAKHYGVETQFMSGLEAITAILGAVVGLLASSYVSTKMYHSAQRNDVPLLGDSR